MLFRSNHNGLITADPREVAGTIFSLYLPVSEKEYREEYRRKDMVIFGKGRILLMDDEEQIRKVMGRLMGRIGYEVECAADGLEAVEKYREAMSAGAPFNVVILDLTVPGGMGGVEALKELRKIDPEVRAIVSSGYSTEAIMANYREKGFRDVLSKPYRIKELGEVLQRCCAS